MRWSGPRRRRTRSLGASGEKVLSQIFSNNGGNIGSWVDVRTAQQSRMDSLHRMCAHEDYEQQGRASKDRGVRVEVTELSRL